MNTLLKLDTHHILAAEYKHDIYQHYSYSAAGFAVGEPDQSKTICCAPATVEKIKSKHGSSTRFFMHFMMELSY